MASASPRTKKKRNDGSTRRANREAWQRSSEPAAAELAIGKTSDKEERRSDFIAAPRARLLPAGHAPIPLGVGEGMGLRPRGARPDVRKRRKCAVRPGRQAPFLQQHPGRIVGV